jgi:flavin reductase (DIM6/NTAB) family NADH-FMN oxidoreductase RutF
LNHIPRTEDLEAATAHAPDFSQTEFRQALGQFATGVTVVTARSASGALVGLTVNSFNAVSLDPPLVLWSLGLRSASMEVLRSCTHYAINVLGADHQALAKQFATKDIDRFAGVAWHAGAYGLPLIDGAVATFECFNRNRYAEGDHVIFVGEVERCTHRAAAAPLVYYASQFFTGGLR